MLMNGQKVNYLVLNGEKFTSESAFPKYYKFKNQSELKFYNLELDSSNNIVFSIQRRRQWETNDWLYYAAYLSEKNLVLDIIKNNGEQYALTYCMVDFKTGYVGYQAIAAWIKVSEAGGMTPADTAGGVNNPFYLLFLYCCLILLAWEVAFLC